MLDIILSAILGTWIIRFVINISNQQTRQDIIKTMTGTETNPHNVLFSRFRLIERASRLAVATHRESGAQVHLYSEKEVEKYLKKYDEFQLRLCNQRDPEDSEWEM